MELGEFLLNEFQVRRGSGMSFSGEFSCLRLDKDVPPPAVLLAISNSEEA